MTLSATKEYADNTSQEAYDVTIMTMTLPLISHDQK